MLLDLAFEFLVGRIMSKIRRVRIVVIGVLLTLVLSAINLAVR